MLDNTGWISVVHLQEWTMGVHVSPPFYESFSHPPFRPLQVIWEPSHGRARLFHVCHVHFLKFPIPFSRLLMGWRPSHPDFSETAFYLYLLFQWFFFFSRNFYQVWTQRLMLSVLKSEAAYCKLQERNEVVRFNSWQKCVLDQRRPSLGTKVKSLPNLPCVLVHGDSLHMCQIAYLEHVLHIWYHKHIDM